MENGKGNCVAHTCWHGIRGVVAPPCVVAGGGRAGRSVLREHKHSLPHVELTPRTGDSEVLSSINLIDEGILS